MIFIWANNRLMDFFGVNRVSLRAIVKTNSSSRVGPQWSTNLSIMRFNVASFPRLNSNAEPWLSRKKLKSSCPKALRLIKLMDLLFFFNGFVVLLFHLINIFFLTNALINLVEVTKYIIQILIQIYLFFWVSQDP